MRRVKSCKQLAADNQNVNIAVEEPVFDAFLIDFYITVLVLRITLFETKKITLFESTGATKKPTKYTGRV